MLEGDPKGDSQSILKHKINLQYPTLALPKSIFLLLCLVCVLAPVKFLTLENVEAKTL